MRPTLGHKPVGEGISQTERAISLAGYEVLEGALPEQVGYHRASDEGKAATETRYLSLNQRAEVFAQSMVNKISALVHDKDQTEK
jgi:chromosome partitioning protein